MNKKIAPVIAGALLAAASAPQALRAETIDCPLRDAPYSIELPLIDLLSSDAARAVINEATPGTLDKIPPFLSSTQVPGFSAIITLPDAFGMVRADTALLSRIDEGLRELPVSPQARATRCSRYDDEAIGVPAGDTRPRLLIFEKITGFRDGPSVAAAREAVKRIAAAQGWSVVVTDRGGAIRDEILDHFDAVVWNNISGDVLTLTQRAALKAYVESGGGFVGLHGSAGDPTYFWDWYVDNLIGTRFTGHPMPDQFQPATIRIVAPSGALGDNLPQSFTLVEEWYSFEAAPTGSDTNIVATLDEATYEPIGMMGTDLRMGDHPIVWTRRIGAGRMFYTAIGHRPEVYDDTHYAQLLQNGLKWSVESGGGTTPQQPAR